MRRVGANSPKSMPESLPDARLPWASSCQMERLCLRKHASSSRTDMRPTLDPPATGKSEPSLLPLEDCGRLGSTMLRLPLPSPWGNSSKGGIVGGARCPYAGFHDGHGGGPAHTCSRPLRLPNTVGISIGVGILCHVVREPVPRLNSSEGKSRITSTASSSISWARCLGPTRPAPIVCASAR